MTNFNLAAPPTTDKELFEFIVKELTVINCILDEASKEQDIDSVKCSTHYAQELIKLLIKLFKES